MSEDTTNSIKDTQAPNKKKLVLQHTGIAKVLTKDNQLFEMISENLDDKERIQ